MNYSSKIVALIVILSIPMSIFATTYHLKKSAVVFNKNIYLSDIVKEYVPYTNDFIIGKVTTDGTFTLYLAKKIKNITLDKNKIIVKYEYIDNLQKRIKSFIRYKLSTLSSDCIINIKSRLPASNDYDILLQTYPPIGWITIRLIKDKISKSVSLYVKVSKEVYIASVDIPSKHVITKNDVEKIIMNITSIYRSIPQKVIGMMSRYYIRKGGIIYTNYIMQPLDVVQGETVLMVLKYKNIKLDDYGIALSDGRIGDIIRIMNIKSRNIVIGKVIQRGIVEVIIK